MHQQQGRYCYISKPLAFAGKIAMYRSMAILTPRQRSDIHFWKTGRIGSLVVEGDCILGHEAAGVVLQCGDGVTNLKPGTLKTHFSLTTMTDNDIVR